MFVFDSIIIEALWVGVSVGGILICATLVVGRRKMKANARRMKRDNLSGIGSLVSHGMIYDDERGVGVIRDSKPSDNWYQKLI